MNDPDLSHATITIDMKKYRIRIFKTTLHLLGDPSYIQLLVNPTDGFVAIRSVERSLSKDQTHKVSKKMMDSDNSIEIYSRLFITKLLDVAGNIDTGSLYQMNRKVVPSENLAIFSLKTMTKKAP